MIKVIDIANPFEPQRDMRRFESYAGVTVLEWLRDYKQDAKFLYFDRPTLLQLNGVPVLPVASEEFPEALTYATALLRDGDLVTITAIPQGLETVLVVALAVVLSVAITFLLSDPALPSDASQGDTVYTLKGQSNQVRLGDPVERHYGAVRIFPSYAAPPYNRYIGNQQYQYSLFCLGLGTFDFDPENDVFIEDTPAGNFEEVELEVIEPGGTSSLISQSAVTSVEVANIELYGPNQDEYPADGWFGGFVANPAGTEIELIEVDVTLPQGLYRIDSDGKRQAISVLIEFEARLIDDAGDPLGSYFNIVDETITRSTTTPQRITFAAEVAAGRYEVRGRRTSDFAFSSQRANLTQWEALRGLAPDATTYPDCTMLAVKVLATSNINNNTRSRWNVYATAELPIYDADLETWGAPEATRNPVWAFCDIFRSTYGARLADEFLDLDGLATLAAALEIREDYFDGTFDRAVTVWDAAKSIARVCRSTPVPQGSLITMIRDDVQEVPSGLFNQENMVEGSFQEEVHIHEFGAFDSLIVEYLDPITWKPLEVECVLPGELRENPDRVKMFGVTSRAQAYREGMYILASRRFARTNYRFRTGLEGHIPTYLDMVGIYHDVIQGPRAGFVVAYDSGTNVMTLSERVVFAEGHTHSITLRAADGSAQETIEVTEGAASNQVILQIDPDPALDFSADQMPPLFFFGIAQINLVKGKVVEIRPIDEEEVEIGLLIYDERVYSFDDFPVPALPAATGIVNPGAPSIGSVTIAVLPDAPELIMVSWTPAVGAQEYIVQRTFDVPTDEFSEWEQVATVDGNNNVLEIAAVPGEVVYRVAARAAGGRGAWTESAEAEVGVPLLGAFDTGFNFDFDT